MDSLSHTPGATEVLPEFYDRSVLVWVEEREDTVFWGHIIRLTGIESVGVKVGGCKPELLKVAKQVVGGTRCTVVAMDDDYDGLAGKRIPHSRIVYTHGYSIENTLYCARSMAQSVSDRTGDLDIEKIQKQVQAIAGLFVKDVYELLVCDYATQKYMLGKRVMGDNCARYLVNNTSTLANKQAVQEKVDEVSGVIESEIAAECRTEIEDDERDAFWLVRGHFLTTLARNIIKKLVKARDKESKSITNDALFAELVKCCRSCEKKDECRIIGSMKRALETAIVESMI